MTTGAGASVHASAVLVQHHAVLIRGPSGAGKSRLAFDLILAGRAGLIPPAILVGDDRIFLDRREGRLVARPARELAGLIEIFGLGIRRCDFRQEAVVSLVVDLCAPDAERLPPPQALLTSILGGIIPRLPVGAGMSALPLVVAALTTTEGAVYPDSSADCLKGIGNHITHTLATE